MDSKRRFTPPPVGGVSLLVVFAVLCLTVFALLSLSTVRADDRLSQASARAVSGYYAADCQAQEVLARLRAGELYRGNYVAHTRPDGSPWETVLQQDVPTDYAYAGENLAWSNHLPDEELGAFQWFRLWQESKSHLAAMVNERYTHCGIAVLTGPYYEGEAQSYAVAVFCSY